MAETYDAVEPAARPGGRPPGRTRVAVVTDPGAGDRPTREAMRHDGFELRVDGVRHRVPVRVITGHPMTFQGQQELVEDLIALRLGTGAPLLFEAPVEGLDGSAGDPVGPYRQDRAAQELRCEAVVARFPQAVAG